MTIDDFRERYHAEPFRPFVVRLRSGERMRVSARYHIGFHPQGRLVTVSLPGEEFRSFDVSEAVSIDDTRGRRRKAGAKR